MRSAIEIFCSRVVFRQRFFRKNNEMADEYDANAGGKIINSDSGECFVDFEAAGTSEAASTLECLRQLTKN